MVKFPFWILSCDSLSPALFNLLISSDTSFCSPVTFHLLGNSDHVLSVSIEIPLNWKGDAPFYRTAHDDSRAD